MAEEVVLMKGNEAIAHAAIRCGADGYFGYPITPQSEVLETLAELKPWETTGMVVLQAESEVAAINMVYGGAGSGKMVMTSSSSPGVSLKQEGISYIAGAELPCLIVNVMRGGPGLGTIQPSQADYFQTVKGGGHGDYRLIALAPASVQEMADFVSLGFELAFKYRNPAIILADGVIGQMMEKVVLPAQKPRRTDAEVIEQCPWATTGRTNGRKPNVITSLELKPEEMEKNNIRFQAKYKEIEENEVRFEEIHCEDAEYLIVAFGSMARIGQKAMEMAQKVLDKEDATEEEITEALKNLENAIGSLVKKEDTSSPSTDQDETTNQGADKNTSQNTDQKNDKNVVKTGDDSMVIPFVAAIAISVAAAAFIICRRMRRK